MVQLQCLFCGDKFQVKTKRRHQRYCSPRCSFLSYKRSFLVPCIRCGKEYTTIPARILSGNICCSRACGHAHPPAVERFWKQVQKGEAPNSHWLWNGGQKGGGYGCFMANHQIVLAHRFSWELHNGPIPDGLWVLHNCDPLPDCKSCVNPDHLYLGDHNANMKDASLKHQHLHGENHGKHKLTEVQVIAMRQAYHFLGYTIAQLTRQYPVSFQTMSRIIKGLFWKHLPVTPEALRQFLKEHPSYLETHSPAVR